MPRMKLLCSTALAVAVASAGCSLAQISVQVEPERASVVSGEPLVLDIWITNRSGTDFLLQRHNGWMKREIVYPDGSVRAWSPPPAPGDSGYFGMGIPAGERRHLSVVSPETAMLVTPGEYRMIVDSPQLHLSVPIRFSVLPYDRATLESYAEHVLANPKPEEVENNITVIEVLTALRGEVGEPYLCRALRQDSTMIFHAADRLEELGDRGSVNCLIELRQLYSARDERNVVDSVLRRIDAKTRDLVLHSEIREALRR
ncbi:MAG: hypothetical protein JO340_04795 [Acidobacteriaceae bacterium]|nr:hypothetical protein [Acidobacteriaceae bacterium]